MKVTTKNSVNHRETYQYSVAFTKNKNEKKIKCTTVQPQQPQTIAVLNKICKSEARKSPSQSDSTNFNHSNGNSIEFRLKSFRGNREREPVEPVGRLVLPWTNKRKPHFFLNYFFKKIKRQPSLESHNQTLSESTSIGANHIQLNPFKTKSQSR